MSSDRFAERALTMVRVRRAFRFTMGIEAFFTWHYIRDGGIVTRLMQRRFIRQMKALRSSRMTAAVSIVDRKWQPNMAPCRHRVDQMYVDSHSEIGCLGCGRTVTWPEFIVNGQGEVFTAELVSRYMQRTPPHDPN